MFLNIVIFLQIDTLSNTQSPIPFARPITFLAHINMSGGDLFLK